MNLFRFIPLFRTRPTGPAVGFFDRIFRNRRDPHSCIVMLGDVTMNLSDWWHALYNRVPGGSPISVERDRSGRLESIHYRRD
jgi:hypothetical protein